jgi:hypothetical protein
MVMSETLVKERINLVRHSYRELEEDRHRVRAIIDGGPDGLRALLGNRLKLRDRDIPALNMFESGATRLAHDLGRPPDTKADPFPTARGLTQEDQQNKADKRVRIVESYDHRRLERQLRVQARWLPVYAYCVWVITERIDSEGNRYPVREIRNPYTSYPAWWSFDEQVDEMVTVRRVPPMTLAALYPDKKSKIEEHTGSFSTLYTADAYSLSRPGVEVIEYHSMEGTWIMMDGGDTLLDRADNPLTTGPKFAIGRRPTVNRMIGQYNNAIGLMSHMAKLNVLALIATEDSVFRETNIEGGLENVKYERGRFAVNYLPPGASVSRPTGDFPVAAFEQINRLERQLRIQTQYPVDQDGQSPLSFATGEGIDRLTASGDKMVGEYRAILSETLEWLDSKSLEWDVQMYPDGTKPLHGIHDGEAFFEDYTPAKDIGLQWQIRREYGPMAGIDEPTKIVAGLQLLQANVIDLDTFRQMLHNLGQLDKIRDNVRRDRAERGMFDALEFRMSQGDGTAALVFAEIFKDPDEAGTTLTKFFTPEEPQISPEEEEFLGQGGGPPGAGQQLPDVQTVLSQLSQGGDVGGGGVQTVGRVP